MAILSDRTLRASIEAGRIKVIPFIAENVQPASIDLTLGNRFKTLKNTEDEHTDPRKEQEYNQHGPLTSHEAFILDPLSFALGHTVERIEFPIDLVGRIEGKSSIGRLGLTIHVTAGFFDPGFRGQATLEFFNATHRSILLWPGMKICQMSFHRMTTPAERPYGSEGLGSKYIDQEGVVGSKMHENFPKGKKTGNGD